MADETVINVKSADTTKLTQQHAEYSANNEHWQMLIDGYYGTGKFAPALSDSDDSYIDQYDNEDEAKYNRRKALAYYPNYQNSVVDTYLGHLFKKQPDRRTNNNAILDQFITKTNMRGDVNLSQLMRNAMAIAFNIGFSYILVDMPNIETISKADEIEKGKRAYAYVVSPLDVLDWDLDEHNNFNWVKIKESGIAESNDPFGTHKAITKYRIWTRTEWYLWEADGESDPILIGDGDHNLGVVPLVPVYYEKLNGNTILGNSGIKDIAQMNKRLFNLLSEKDDLLRQQTFSILIYPSNSVDGLKLDTDRVLGYDPSSANKPEFIAPAASTIESYHNDIKLIIDEMFRLARLDHTGIEKHSIARSGISLQLEFEKTEQVLKSLAINLQTAERFVLELVAKWNGMDLPEDIEIEYSQSFGLQDIGVVLENTRDALLLGIESDTYDKKIQEKIVNILLPELNTEDKIKIFRELQESSKKVPVIGKEPYLRPSDEGQTNIADATAIDQGQDTQDQEVVNI
jgi:hypothetical protein